MTIYVDKPLAVPNWPSEGGLSQEEAIKEFAIEEYVKIQMTPKDADDDEENERLKIVSYRLETFSSQFIQFQIEFGQPDQVSIDQSQLDQLELFVIDSSILRDIETGLTVSNNTELEIDVGPQLTREEDLAAVEL